MNNYIQIANFTYPSDLSVIKPLLASNGIKYVVRDEVTVQMHNFYSNAIGGIKLEVPENQFELAQQIIVENGFEDHLHQPVVEYFEDTLTIPWNNILKFWKKPVYPYESYFYNFEKLGEQPTPNKVLKYYPKGSERTQAFQYLKDKYPDQMEYLLLYLFCLVEDGVYDDKHYQYCFDLINQGLSRPNSNESHDKLNYIKANLKREQELLLKEDESDTEDHPIDFNEFEKNFKNKQFSKVIEAFKDSTHQPKGILNTKEDQSYWRLFVLAIESYFEMKDYKKGLRLMKAYEKQRIKLRLTPIPGFRLQEKVIGCLAQKSISLAQKKLQSWLFDSEQPSISETISSHPNFKDIVQAYTVY
ncbi:putative signal transducing protein [Aquimarina brevivitae]|uniref:Putative signal transducing protein n=1 Tax=Aquimarina brevivitae TaxID=323412 RepID=A0A4V2F5N1_9FLAO|nr:DUF2007 domain-containing protein [Aquimarina brevivitae]RZS93399.1 putative signal transducing protein [Aquimarina brevivitae]